MTLKISKEKWRISLPIFPPPDVLDTSVRNAYMRCFRLGLYKYGLRRGFKGTNYPIQFGLAYHKYREVAEALMREAGTKLTSAIHNKAYQAATEGWENPPVDHYKSYLDAGRLHQTLEKARLRIEAEQKAGKIKVIKEEDSFDLELPYPICRDCQYVVFVEDKPTCPNCGSSNLYQPRHGGRVDQHVIFHSIGGKLMVRDFKTTSRMGRTYDQKFDPNGQIQSYVWSGAELSGRKFDGALIETVYNTSTKGPEFFQHYFTYTEGQQEAWMASALIQTSIINSLWSRVDELGYLAFPQNTISCDDFGGCSFREPCKASSAREIESWLENYTIYSHWDFTDPDKEEATS